MTGERLGGWRRIANAVWRAPEDPQIYASLDVDAAPIREALGVARKQKIALTPTHFVGRGLALALREVPELNVRIVSGHAYPRPSVDVFFTAAVERGRELSGVKIEQADEKGVIALANELKGRMRDVKRGGDPGLVKSKEALDRLPMPLLRAALRTVSYLVDARALPVPALSLLPSPFGSAVVTSVGMLGLPGAYAPIPWISPVPILILVGSIEERAVSVSGAIESRKVLPLHATLDHRWVDGWHVARALRIFRRYLEAPLAFEPSLSAAR